ncbi:hypothetical protein Pint_06401 [Pistacia integerrima]|uniref:Uncharacterized protein n=1 Tax=Pistacia integerrima TaxID=434235 RepID=A0ACC0ZAJ8_9ROSI|nr:hypothetical protein Pint_06401 [Pistacia integerrima]
MENQRESPMQQRKKRRVVLFPLPLQGHINPMLQLANILYGKGLSITVIHTNFNSPNTSNYPHFDFCSIPDGLLEVGASTSDVIALVTLLNVNCVVPFRDCLAKLLSNVEEESIACLITDAVCHFTQAVADSLKLPRIVLRTSSISSFLAFAATSLLHEKGFFPIKATCRPHVVRTLQNDLSGSVLTFYRIPQENEWLREKFLREIETEPEALASFSMEIQSESSMRRRVILFPLPLQGHITPMLQLASILHNKGLSITVIHTNFNSPNSVNYPHFDFHSIPDGLSEAVVSVADAVAVMTQVNDNCVEPFRDCLSKLLSNVEEEPIACLITDAMLHFTQSVADSLKLPRIVLRTSNISSFLVFAGTPLLYEKGYLPIKVFRDALAQS